MPIGNALGSEWCLLVPSQQDQHDCWLVPSRNYWADGLPAGQCHGGALALNRCLENVERNLKFRIELAELAGQHFWTLLDFGRMEYCRFLGRLVNTFGFSAFSGGCDEALQVSGVAKWRCLDFL